jgi:orotidine-5'-phosphate decarboxylase
MPLTAREKIIVALDVPTADEARSAMRELAEQAIWCKIGMELFTREGPDIVRFAVDQGFSVFLDLKFHDIPNTVAAGVRSAISLGVKMLTIHASGGPEMMRAAVAAASESDAIVLGVTVLTSSDRATLAAVGLDVEPEEQVLRLASQAQQAGLTGLVCSPLEIRSIRAVLGDSIALVTPGVRPAGSAMGDQKRVLTPGDAVRAGADWLVIGRPIMAAPNRAEAFNAIEEEIARAIPQITPPN